MKSKKGFTLIELLVSIVLISIVLAFILQLYVRIRGTYTGGRVDVDYELTKSMIIDAMSQDFLNDKIVSYSNGSNNSTVTINFEKLGTKTLSVTENDGRYYISYGNLVRKLPVGAEVDNNEYIHITRNIINSKELYEFKIPVYSENGVNYSINAFYSHFS